MSATPGVYKPIGMANCEICQPIEELDYERINALVNGDSRHGSWEPMRVQVYAEDEGVVLDPSDSPWLGSHALIFRDGAIDVLKGLLLQYGEFLPLLCLEAELSMYNPTNVIDALDEDASSLSRFSDGRIIMIEEYVFRSEMVADVAIFKIPSLRVSPTFVSHHFVDWWKGSRLRGLDFKHLWAAEP